MTKIIVEELSVFDLRKKDLTDDVFEKMLEEYLNIIQANGSRIISVSCYYQNNYLNTMVVYERDKKEE